MKWLTILSVALVSVLVNASPIEAEKRELTARATPYGIDVSSYQPSVNWAQVKANGISFAYIKATEGTAYKSASFNTQYVGATNAGLIRGAYHFARPDISTGAAQATYFLANGGGWSSDGITLPGALDIEYNPYGAECYGLSQASMVTWLHSFANTYYSKTTRYPVIYTTTDWWTTCTGNNGGFATTSPLWIASWGSSIGALPAGYSYTTFWQYADSGANPGDADLFNGDAAGLSRMAYGH